MHQRLLPDRSKARPRKPLVQTAVPSGHTLTAISSRHPPLHTPLGAHGPTFHSRTPTPRIPLAFTPQLCPVTCCPSCHGKEAQDWTTKQGLKNHVQMHTTEFLKGPGPGTVAGSTVSSPPRPLPSFFTPFGNLRWFHSALCLCCCFSSQQQQPAAAASTSITTIIINGTPSSISHYHHHQHQQKQPAAAAPAPAPVTNRLLFSPKKKNLKQLAGMPHCRGGDG